MSRCEPYADIHHYDVGNTEVDDEGDTLYGWYFQLMRNARETMTQLIGPYGSRDECEGAAIIEWQEIAA